MMRLLAILLLTLSSCCATANYRDDAGGTELAVFVSCIKRSSDRAQHYVYMKGIQTLLAQYLKAVEEGVPDDYVSLSYGSWLQQIDSWPAESTKQLCNEAYQKGLQSTPLPRTWSQPK